jgi:drug/metabolite transporter (DMT)-like permease
VLCGIASGVLGGLGLPLAYVLYREAPIALVVPVITCVSTLVLSGAGALRDGIAPAASVGLVLCLVAVVLVTREPRAAVPVRSPGALTRGRILFGALAVGVCFGGFAMFLGLAPAGDGIWPLAASRLAALAVAAAVIARSGLPILRRGAWTPVTVVLGLLDVGANLLLVLALSTGDLVTVGVVTALSPAISVVLARVVLGQHLTPTRTFGLLLAVVGLVASTV